MSGVLAKPPIEKTDISFALHWTILRYPTQCYTILPTKTTIHRRLHEDQIRKWRAVICPLLTSAHAKTRLKWAMQWRGLTIDEWRQVIRSDECAVQRDSDGTVKWIFRHQNKRENYDPKNIRGKTKGGGISQMIWGTFAGNKLGPIVFRSE